MGGECAKEGAGVAQRVTAERENLAKSPDHDGGIMTEMRARAWTHWWACFDVLFRYQFTILRAAPALSRAEKGTPCCHGDVVLALHSLRTRTRFSRWVILKQEKT